MAKFQIFQRITGNDLGTFEAYDEQDALDEFARNAGFEDFSDSVLYYESDLPEEDRPTSEEDRDALIERSAANFSVEEVNLEA